MSEFATVAEVAERFRISPFTVYRLVEQQKLEAVRFGSAVRIPTTSIERYLKSHNTLNAPALARKRRRRKGVAE